MKVYKSRFLPKVEKAARKARSHKRGALYAQYIIGNGICTLIQGMYSVRGGVPTGIMDENEGSYLCKFDLQVNPSADFFIDSKGNATQTVGKTSITHDGAFEPLGNYNVLEWINKLFDLKSVESLITVDRKLLIELLEMMEDKYVTLSFVNNKEFSHYTLLKIDGEHNNAFMNPVINKNK